MSSDILSDPVAVQVYELLEVADLEGRRDLMLLEARRAYLLKLRCKLQRELYEKREQLRMPNYKYDPKDKDTPRYTDFDRRNMLEAQTAEINERYELVKGLEELVKERVDLIKILLGAK